PTGHLVYSQNGTLMAVPFDLQRLELTGTPVPVVEDVAQRVSAGFSFSGLGSLVYIPQAGGSGGQTLVWVDRKGTAQSLPVPPHRYGEPRLSPDGRRLALANRDDQKIWLYDIPRGIFSPLTFGRDSGDPVWSPDGKRLTFASIRD